jgi:hypothetical protein
MKKLIYFIFILISINSFGQKPILKTIAINSFGIEYKTLNEGYFESGIELNQIYKGFGLTGFYRYGPNQLPRFEDNLAVKLSFVLDLGL